TRHCNARRSSASPTSSRSTSTSCPRLPTRSPGRRRPRTRRTCRRSPSAPASRCVPRSGTADEGHDAQAARRLGTRRPARLAAANQAMGLVMFSDTAYELLPPNSPASALLAFERFFDPQAVTNSTPVFGVTPWNQFSAGTRISAGLRMGAEALRRAHVTHGSLLLISDLNDSSADEEPLVAEGIALKKAHVPVRIVPVAASPGNVRI